MAKHQKKGCFANNDEASEKQENAVNDKKEN